MEKFEILARFEANPRTVELEIEAAEGTPLEGPFLQALEMTGVKAFGRVTLTKHGRTFLFATLLDERGAALDARRTSRFVDVMNSLLSYGALETSVAA